jgi:hypothetical protein
MRGHICLNRDCEMRHKALHLGVVINVNPVTIRDGGRTGYQGPPYRLSTVSGQPQGPARSTDTGPGRQDHDRQAAGPEHRPISARIQT